MKIESLRMEPADNGCIICYEEITETKAPGQEFANRQYKYRKEVYDFDDDEDMEEAFKRFKELWMMQRS